MVRVSGLEGIFSQANVGLRRIVVFGYNSCLVDNRFSEAVSIHRALSWFSAVACFRLCDLFVQNGFIMFIDVLLQVGHAAVADLNCVTVKDLM